MIVRTAFPSIVDLMQYGPYVGYSYSYPHKTAYRPLSPHRQLSEVWSNEVQSSLFLYLHIPFCEVRCGFCNLFTFSQPEQDVPSQYVSAIIRQAQAVRQALPEARFARMAIGGGTPSFLDEPLLEKLFRMLSDIMFVDGRRVPNSFEVSPHTVDASKMRLLKNFGVQRISMGIQSFDKQDIQSLGRPQKNEDVIHALEQIRAEQFECLNLDLIYGTQNQSVSTWISTVRETIRWQPEEIYLYPLYVRPLTGLAKVGKEASDERMKLYQIGRDELLANGYRQVSMRMFERVPTQAPSPESSPKYCCQSDGMIGLGCGARSYTSSLHYGSDYAVGQTPILRIINDFIARTDDQFQLVQHGYELGTEERKRRFLIQSLLLAKGLEFAQYEEEFQAKVLDEFPMLAELQNLHLADITSTTIRLSAEGLAWSDTIGPWLYSNSVQERMAEYPWSD